MTAKTMAEVLAEHWSVSTHADKDNEPLVDKCDGCGKVLHTWGDQIPEIHPLVAHQAAALSAAGFGLVSDAKAEAWDHGHHDGAVDAMLHMENDGPKTAAHVRNPS